jgi:hypothetical protein
MKKFKSLMLAALASAALAAPSFAEGHGGGLAMTGEIVVGMKYESSTPDGGDTTANQDTYIGDVNAKLTGTVSDTASYAFEFQRDDEAAADAGLNFEMKGTASSGDNSIEAFAEITDITEGPAGQGYGDVYIKGSNKTLTVQVGKFGNSENWSGGYGYYRAGTFRVGNASCGATSDPKLGNIEHITISGFQGIEVDIDAGDITLEAAVPWMKVSKGDGTKAAGCTTYALVSEDTGLEVDTNVSGIRPTIKAALGGVDLSATAYSLSFSPQTSGVNTVEKTDTAFQLMASVTAGNNTSAGLGYTAKTTTDGDAESNPSTLNGWVKVGLGGAQHIGASFVILDDGAEEDAATATQIAASYGMPFFVEAVTLKLGVGTTTQTSDDSTKAGASSGLEAEWVYNF